MGIFFHQCFVELGPRHLQKSGIPDPHPYTHDGLGHMSIPVTTTDTPQDTPLFHMHMWLSAVTMVGYVLWLPCQWAWLSGIAVRVQVWYSIDMVSRRDGVTALSLHYSISQCLNDTRPSYLNIKLIILWHATASLGYGVGAWEEYKPRLGEG